MTPEAKDYTTKAGDDLTFLFTHRALIAAERSAKAGLGQLLQEFGEGGFGAIASLIHGGLVVHQPATTFDDALALWESDGQAVVKAMAEALNAAMPVVAAMLGVQLRPRKGAAAKAPASPKPSGTGSRSSARGAKRG